MVRAPDESLDLTLISRRYPPQIGGAERVMENLAHGFASLGHRVTVVSSENRAEGVTCSSDLTPADERRNPKLVRLPYNGIRILGTALYMDELRRWLDRHPPDLAYVSMLKHDAYVAVGFGLRRRVPIVLRPEGAGVTGDISWQGKGRFGPVISKRTRKADALVALSPRIREELSQAGYDQNRIRLIPNGVPIPENAWTTPHPDRPPCAVFVGRLASEKGLDRLLNAWRFVSAEMPLARLSIVGDGPLASSLKSQAIELGISNSVDFLGSRTDIIELLTHSNLFILPSREEGLSMALLEAMALGLPVVVSDIPGNRTLVKEGKTGRIVNADDPKSLSSAIVSSFSGDRATLAMASEGRRLISERYSIRTMVLEHMDLFRQLIVLKHRD